MRRLILIALISVAMPMAFAQDHQRELDSLMDLYNKGPHDTAQVYLLSRMSEVNAKLEQHEESMRLAKEAYDKAKHAKFRRGLVHAHRALSNIYGAIGNMESAYDHLWMKYQIQEEANNKAGAASALNDLGSLERDRGNFSKAIDFFIEALRISESTNYQGLTLIVINNLGSTYEKFGDHEKAIEYFSRALVIHREDKNNYGEALVLNNMGVSYMSQGLSDSALSCYKRSIRIFSKDDYAYEIAYNYNNIGSMYYYSGNLDSARINYKRSLAIRRVTRDVAGMATNHNNLGIIARDKKEYERALAHFDSSLTISLKHEIKSLQRTTYENISTTYREMNDYEHAFEFLTKSAEIQDSLMNEVNFRQIAELEIRYEMEKTEKELLIKDMELKKNIADRERNQARIDQNAAITSERRTSNYILISLIILALATSGLLFNRYILSQKHKRDELERATVEIEQRLLRAQMNPRFIFKSLNAIKSFITTNRANGAERFLSKFARLMRYILDNSSKSQIAVTDEIKTIELYLELEQLRHDNQFSFEVDIDDELEADELGIPPMLTQPFVENAIAESLAAAQSNPIRIRFSERDDILTFTIAHGTDSQMTKENPALTKAWEVTMDRIKLLNQKTRQDIQVTLDNHAPGQNRVELAIPVSIL